MLASAVSSYDMGYAFGRLMGMVLLVALVIVGIVAIVRNNARAARQNGVGGTGPAPANWYADPEDPRQLRYWDGLNWTEHRAPRPPG